ncbi:DUF2236 domain-containing protein [Prauserella sp. PE36]|uniref:oxygenase MpaB family protein n=1 Tax=Prauserella sp. PE36 TaxID=1504709 RepID=UPI000DE51355|nr:oxygenase MpaB family protein [Prauserella sp. PE36]RBM12577.1 DUF2236 domain-containing protein [Prauserella sp. PE36]
MDDDTMAGAGELPGPGSVTWERFAAAPGVFLAGTGLLLQVAHPVVGAGVLDHSEFKEKPWVRAWRTHLSTIRFVYGMGQGAHAEGRRLLELHKGIKGVDSEGRRYHALDPEAYAWVHLTLAKYMVDTAAWFGEPFTDAELERMWREFRAVGLALGIKPQHLAPGWKAAQSHFDEMVNSTLEANRSTEDVLAALTHPKKPWPLLPDPLWKVVAVPSGRLVRMTTVGTLPPVLRERLGLPWTDRDQRRLERFARTVRAMYRRAPEPLRLAPLAYGVVLRARKRARANTGSPRSVRAA